MGGGVFFVNWALWEEMTFVLACAIVVVFFIGLVKLGITNRKLRKLEKMDIEKAARVTEMRKAGVNQRRKNDVPFGVRAIQSGIEIDGIWISRPNTPRSISSNTKLLTPSVTNMSDNGKQQQQQPESRPYTGSTLAGTRLPSGLNGSSSNNVNNAAGSNGNDSAGHTSNASDASEARSTASTPLPQISEDGMFMTGGNGNPDALNEEALRRLEGNYNPPDTVLREHQMPTYVPTNRVSNSNTRQYYNSPTGYNNSSDSQSSSSRSTSNSSRQGRRTSQENRTSPSMSPVAGPSTLVPPAAHANLATRKVNPNFEVLPAGTFMTRNPSNHSSADDEAEPEVAVRESLLPAGRNKLRKAAPPS